MTNKRLRFGCMVSCCLLITGCGGCTAKPDPKADAIKKVDEGLNSPDPQERVKAADEAAKTWEGKK